MNLKCAAKRLCMIPGIDVEVYNGRPWHVCLHCGGSVHGGACAAKMPYLIEKRDINVLALNNDTTTNPDESTCLPADKVALARCYQNQLICQFCWQIEAILHLSTAAVPVNEPDAETATAPGDANAQPVSKTATVPRLPLVEKTCSIRLQIWVSGWVLGKVLTLTRPKKHEQNHLIVLLQSNWPYSTS